MAVAKTRVGSTVGDAVRSGARLGAYVVGAGRPNSSGSA
jgi:hypothetical protein